MATISAHKGRKIAEAHRDASGTYDNGLAWAYRIHMVLTSDGRVLRATSDPRGTDSYARRRSGYKLHGHIRGGVVAFTQWAQRHGYTVTSPVMVPNITEGDA